VARHAVRVALTVCCAHSYAKLFPNSARLMREFVQHKLSWAAETDELVRCVVVPWFGERSTRV